MTLNPMFGLLGCALVTGAGSGIGASTACAFAAAGCRKIALVDVNEEGMKATEKRIEDQGNPDKDLEVKSYSCDVSNAEQVSQTFSRIKSDLGRLDYAVNCAGLGAVYAPSTEASIETFDRINSVNYRGIWLCAREELRIMKDQSLNSEVYAEIPEYRAQRGAIVHISSSLGLVAMPQSPAYCAAKAGVISLTRSDALDYSQHRIRVNTVMPGIVDTPMTQAPPTPEILKQLTPMIPLKRVAEPEEIADVAVFLCSTRASYIQGAAVAADGGWLII